MLADQIVVVVVVQHAHTGGVRTGSNDHVCGRQPVMSDLG